MEFDAGYWVVEFSNGWVVSLTGMLLYLAGAVSLAWKPIVDGRVNIAMAVIGAYSLVWYLLGIWWITT